MSNELCRARGLSFFAISVLMMPVVAHSQGSPAATVTTATPSAGLDTTATAAPSSAAPAIAARLRSAPTLEALARMKAAEKEAQAQERYAKLFPPAPQPVTVKPKAEVVVRVPQPNASVEPQRIRRVLAVHGRVGAEQVDIERGDGVVGTFAVGSMVDGYRIRKVLAEGVVLDAPSRPCLAQAQAATSARKSNRGTATPTTAQCSGGTTTVKVGGLFR